MEVNDSEGYNHSLHMEKRERIEHKIVRLFFLVDCS